MGCFIACLQSRPRNGQNRKCGRFLKILLVKSVTSLYQIRQNIVSRPFLLTSSKGVLGNHAYVFNTVKSPCHAYVFDTGKSSVEQLQRNHLTSLLVFKAK